MIINNEKIEGINFIVIEGGEGVGKSSLISHLKDEFEALGREVVITREPGGTKASEEIRAIIMNNNLSNEIEIKLFAMAREIHNMELIYPSIAENKVVICDRYIMSNYVYQGYLHSEEEQSERFFELLDIANKNFVKPDYTFVLDMEVEKALARIKKDESREVNKFDEMKIEKHQKIRSAFIEQSKRTNNSYIIDADKASEKVCADIMDIFKKQ